MPAEAVEAVTTGDVAKDAQNLMADEFFYRGSQHAVTRAKPQSDRRPPDARDVAKFMAWLAAHGADTSRLRWPVMQGGDRKAFARVDVAADAAALRVPEALMMSPSKALASEIGAACDRHGLRGDVLLATFIVFELRKGEKSFWAPYLGMLETPATCCDWASEDLDALHDPELRERTESRERWILDLYERYFTKTLCMRHPDLFPVDCFTYERFRFAWFVVQSRAFGRKLRETSLVPLADCLNHSATVACSYRLVKGCFELFPTQDGQCVRGRELLNSYGPCPNSKLLLDYGFALLDNPHDTVRLALQLRPVSDDALVERRRTLLRRGGCSPYPNFLLRRGQVPSDALAFLRVALADPPTLARREALPDGADVLGAFPGDEARVVDYLDGLLETIGDDCGPPRIEDDAALAAAPAPRLAFALRYRATRRAVVESCREALRALSSV